MCERESVSLCERGQVRSETVWVRNRANVESERGEKEREKKCVCESERVEVGSESVCVTERESESRE